MAIRFFDMFAGIGGFRSGLEAIGGFECIGHCEIDKNANQAYNAIYEPKGELYFEDARTINPNDLPDIDLICAGFPCQSFSVAGKRLGFADDTRGTLFFEVARIAEAKRPAYLLLENVPGLLSHDGGRTLTTIFSALVELGYDLEWCVHNSANFGVPQQRRRLYIVGSLGGRSAGRIFPLSCGNAENLKQFIPGPQGQRVYEIDGVACTQTAGAGGWGGKTGLYLIDMNPDPVITDNARCLIARYDAGVGNHKGINSGVLVEDDEPRAILNRLDYGKKYCHHSPTIEESVLQKAIMNAIIATAKQNIEVLKTLKLHIGMGLDAEETEDKSLDIQIRIAEIDAEFKAMLQAVSAQTADNFDDNRATTLMNEKNKLLGQLEQISATKQKRKNAKSRLDEIYTILDGLKNHPLTYDDQIIRQILECVIVESKEQIKVVFVGGLEVTEPLN